MQQKLLVDLLEVHYKHCGKSWAFRWQTLAQVKQEAPLRIKVTFVFFWELCSTLVVARTWSGCSHEVQHLPAPPPQVWPLQKPGRAVQK
ncbi:unnamed protein product [Coccothraustes coccothraustes]